MSKLDDYLWSRLDDVDVRWLVERLASEFQAAVYRALTTEHPPIPWTDSMPSWWSQQLATHASILLGSVG